MRKRQRSIDGEHGGDYRGQLLIHPASTHIPL
jgi:hypothetical protein